MQPCQAYVLTKIEMIQQNVEFVVQKGFYLSIRMKKCSEARNNFFRINTEKCGLDLLYEGSVFWSGFLDSLQAVLCLQEGEPDQDCSV